MITNFLAIPLFIWGAVALGTLVFGTAIYSNMKKDVANSYSIGILGTILSGKTLFLKRLQQQRETHQSTGIEIYEEFELTLSNGKKITIKKGVDIGGSDGFITQYEKIIKSSDMLFFFFDSSRVEENEYFRGMSMRLDFTSEMIEKYNKNIKLWIVGSHLDQSNKNKEELKRFLATKFMNMKYNDILDLERISFLNLQDKKSVKELINKVF